MEIHGVADLQGLPYLVMPYLRGPSLQRRLDDDGPLALVEILRIGMQTAAGLAAAHAQGLIHRDVKPANILLADGVERVKLTDFGLARAADDASLTKSGVITGTPQYMSPEQARGESVDQRSDLFSLGSVLYAMCTGRAPFRAETSYGVLRRVTDDEPRPICEINPEVPEWLANVVAKLMSKQPVDRFASAVEVAELLEKCLAHVQQPTVAPLPDSIENRSNGSFLWRSPLRVGVFVMIATLCLGLLLSVTWQGKEASDRSSPESAPDATTVRTQQTKAEPQSHEAAPRRLRQLTSFTNGHALSVAYSTDGSLIAVANGNPTLTMLGDGKSKPDDDWKPMVDVLDAKSGKRIASLKLSAEAEDAAIAATPRISHIEATALAFSPDGKMVVVGTNIGQAELFNAWTGELVRSLDDEPARLADKQTPNAWKTLRRAMGSVTALAFSPDGSQLAVCGTSFADFSDRFDGVERMGFRTTGPGRLKLWDVHTGTLKHDLAGHNDQVYALAFSPDGKRLASAGRWHSKGDMFGNGVILWDAQAGTPIHSLIKSNANGGVRSIAFSPDGTMLALGTQRFGDSGNSSTGGVSLVHVSSGIEEWLVKVPGWARPTAFSTDGKQVLVLCGGRMIRFLAVDDGSTKREITLDATQKDAQWMAFALAPKVDMMAIGAVDQSQKGSVEVWRMPSGIDASQPAPTPQHEANPTSQTVRHFATESPVKTIACSEDGKVVAVANGGPRFTGFKAKVNIQADWKPLATLLEAETGKRIASLTLTTPEEDAVYAETDQVADVEVTALALSPDGRQAAVGTNVGQIKLYNAQTGDLMCTLDDEHARLADTQSPERWKQIRRAMGSVASLAYSPDGSRLAACGSSFDDSSRVFSRASRTDAPRTGPGRLELWDVKTGKLELDLVGHSQVNAAAFSPDGRLLASVGRWVGEDATGSGVVIWDAETGAKIRTVIADANHRVHTTAFSHDGKHLAIASLHLDVDKADDAITSTISLINVASGVTAWRKTTSGSARPIAFYSDAVLALIGGQSMQLFQVETGQTLMALNRPPDPKGVGQWNDFLIVKHGHMWVIGGEDGDHKGTIEILDPDRPVETNPSSRERKR